MPALNPDPAKQKLVTELIAKCEGLLQSRQLEEAISTCREVMAIAPENLRAKELLEEAQSKLEADVFVRENLRRAQDYFQTRDFQKTVAECQKIQLLDPENQEAAELMQKAQEKLEAEPFVENFVSSGHSLFDSGLYSEAISQWDKVRAIDPEYPGLDDLIRQAREKMEGGNAEDSAIIFDPQNLNPADKFGGMADMPVPVVKSSGTEQTKIEQLLSEGDQLYMAGQYQKAIEVWSEIFMLDVNHPEAIDKIENARKAATEQRIQMKDLLKNAQAAFEQGDTKKARELFVQLKSMDPDNNEASKYLALLGGGSQTTAEPQLDDLLSMAKSAEDRGQYREAAQYYSQVLAVDAENASLADKIKTLNLLAKKQEQGKMLLSNAKAFLTEGKTDSARHAISKVLETDPANKEALDLMEQVKQLSSSSSTTGESASVGSVRPVVKAKKAPSLPLPPAALAAAGIVVLAAIGYFFFFSSGADSAKQPVTPMKPIAKKAPTVAKKANPAPPKQRLNPEQQEQRDRLLKEAAFYLREKRYDEVIRTSSIVMEIEPDNKEALEMKNQAEKAIADLEALEKKLLTDANQYYEYSEFAGAAKLYERYLEKHPELRSEIMPQIIKCYYNLGVLAIRQFKCTLAADYFRQVLFEDPTDQLSKDALQIARECEKSGTGSLEVKKAIALMEMRK